jgi:hypothetical protein
MGELRIKEGEAWKVSGPILRQRAENVAGPQYPSVTRTGQSAV